MHYLFYCKGTSADIIHIKQFKEWRMTGLAFEFGDQLYIKSNRTMMAYAEGFVKTGQARGMKKEVVGFWGDIGQWCKSNDIANFINILYMHVYIYINIRK
jgi:hypothetical protein